MQFPDLPVEILTEVVSYLPLSECNNLKGIKNQSVDQAIQNNSFSLLSKFEKELKIKIKDEKSLFYKFQAQRILNILVYLKSDPKNSAFSCLTRAYRCYQFVFAKINEESPFFIRLAKELNPSNKARPRKMLEFYRGTSRSFYINAFVHKFEKESILLKCLEAFFLYLPIKEKPEEYRTISEKALKLAYDTKKVCAYLLRPSSQGGFVLSRIKKSADGQPEFEHVMNSDPLNISKTIDLLFQGINKCEREGSYPLFDVLYLRPNPQHS